MTGKEIHKKIDTIVQCIGKEKNKAIPLLQAIQDEYNYLPEEAIRRLCNITEITPSQAYGISTFYSQFRHQPVGKHIIKVCVGTACHVKGAGRVYDAFRRTLNLKDGQDTDAEGQFTVEQVACLGCCTIAPVVQIDDITYGHVTTEDTSQILKDYLANKDKKKDEKKVASSAKRVSQGEVRIGLGSCCVASGSAGIKEELEQTLNEKNIRVDVKHVGCVGVCNQVPLMEIHKEGEMPVFYAKVKPGEVREIVFRHFKPNRLVDRLSGNFGLLLDNIVSRGFPRSYKKYDKDKRDTPLDNFLKEQLNIATEYHGILKPVDIEEYKKLHGFEALHKCIKSYSGEAIIETIKKSRLKGRGGAGFPTGIKWEFVKKSKNQKKYIICNGDEGDPGAFMDRMLLESYPFRILEGIIIAAYAVNANEGLLYIRAEYPLAVTRIKEAIKACEEEGYLGENIMGSGFSFHLKVFEGAGAFVCGEETALIASVEGKRGLPALRPPYPSQKGLYGKPTLISNTETYSLVPWILRQGAEEFEKIGTERSKGTKVFALAGKIKRGGLIEVPMGITIRKIVEDIGGGIAGDKKFKAVQIGGPSGGCIPAYLADTPVDFHSLKEVGAMMGSGGLVVLDDTDCMVEIARYFLSFTQDQSCGRCTFCRVGTRRMLQIMEKICRGKGVLKDIDALENLSNRVIEGSICGLGKTAPNPVLSTLKYFREEYVAHIEGTCPTGKCKEMTTYEITDDCIGCTKCAQRCPADAIEAVPYEVHTIDKEKCVKCDLCRQVCPVDAVITK